MKPYPDHPKARHFVTIGLFVELKSFEQLNQRIFDLGPEMDQNDRNGYRGAAFEVFTEAFLTVVHRNRFAAVLPQRRWTSDLLTALSIPRIDKGIDFICERPEDGQEPYATVQSKWRQDRDHTLLYAETSNFYGWGDIGRINEKLIVTSCPRVHPDLGKQLKATFILRNELDQLVPEDFQQMEGWLKGRKPQPKKLGPRKYQIEAVNKLKDELNVSDRASCIMFCGTGKTYVALWLIEAMDSKLTLVLVPSLLLLNQILRDWRRELDFNAICVCSDNDVNEDEYLKPEERPFQVINNAEAIRNFLKSSVERKIVFSTYQSSKKVKEALENTKFEFDLGIFDEAHKTAGREKPERNFALALKNERIPIAKRAFFTATPRLFKPRGGDVTAEEFFSMNKVEDYGNQVVKVTYKEVCPEWVTPFAIFVSVIEQAVIDEELKRRPDLHAELIKQGVTNIQGDEIRTAQVADQITARLMIDEQGCNKLFAYFLKVDHAKSFVSKGPEGFNSHYPGFWCDYVDGSMSVDTRNETLDRLKNKLRGLVANVNCLTEGYNAPSVDGVLICVAKQSRNDIVQMVGRGVRPCKETGKTRCVIGLTILKNPDESIEEAEKRSRFDTLLTVLKALKDQGYTPDEIRELMVVKRVKGFGGHAERKEMERPRVELDDLEQAIKLYAYEALLRDFDALWDAQFAKAEAYFKKFGHCNVSEEEDQQLYYWQVVQRGLAKRGNLRSDREARLKTIKFCFDTDKALYLHHAGALVDWYKCSRTWIIPQKTEPLLAGWAARVRGAKRKGNLPSEAFELLEAHKFPWDPNEENKKERLKRDLAIIAQIGEVFQKNGNRRVPAEFKQYADKWRAAEKKDQLGPEIKEALLAIGFSFDPHDEAFDEKFERFCENQRTGTKSTGSDKSWLANQQTDFKAGRMRADRLARFQEEGYAWALGDQRDAAWHQRLDEYCHHVQKTGDRCCITAPKPLRNWMSIQRRDYRDYNDYRDYRAKKKELSEDRIKVLEARLSEGSVKVLEARFKLLEAAGFLWEHPTTSYPHTHCKRGHEFTKENTGWDKRGTRRCLKCDALRARLKRVKGKREDNNEKAA